MHDSNWREKTLNQLKEIFQNDNDVLSLSIFGSLSDSKIKTDKWSDLDILLVVKDEKLDNYYPSTKYLKILGNLFATQLFSESHKKTTKIIFEDFRKVDIVVITYSEILKDNFISSKQKIIFSKSEEITNKLEQNTNISSALNFKQYDFEKLENEFWFTAYTAVIKTMRKDILIGMHLSLELYKNCLVLAMWLRDKETGTNIHRFGEIKNELVQDMDIKITDLSETGILKFIEKCGTEFDELASQRSVEYIPKHIQFKKLTNNI